MLLESFLDGPEVSLFCVVDGETVVPLLPAQDFKRVGDGDTGPNTGGMGAYAPLPWLPDDVTDAIVDDIVKPVAAELVRAGTSFSGLLYAGLAITSQGPAVVEFNCRFGDPETQAVLALLDTPLGQLLACRGDGRPWPSSRRCAGATAPPWRWCWPPRTTRAGRGWATSSSALRPTVCCTPAPRDATTAPSCRRAGGCCRWSGRVPTWPRRATPPTRLIKSIRLPGSHFRTDIGLAAAEGRISV